MTVGRPRASSREILAEAASELFLECGYAATSVEDITRRAGVSRSSFFNYFTSKADVLWAGLDARLDDAVRLLGDGADPDATLRGIVAGFTPDTLALAVANAEPMGVVDELERERAVRQARLARAVAERLRRGGVAPLTAEVHAAAAAGAVLAAVWAWAHAGAGRTPLPETLDAALAAVPGIRGDVRQLRVVVRTDDFDEALAFYRDAAGMPVAAAYEADDDARVAILDAGRATLELANPAQAAFIDRVETDGDAPSDRIRLALEVDDAAAAQERLAAAGATVQAAARETPWRSLNARLRAPGALQVTLFQELGDV